MKAIRVAKFGPPEVMTLEDVPDLVPAAGQVLVQLKAAGVNPVDTYIRAGSYAQLPTPPYTPGFDGAGTVERVGAGVTHFTPGQRVYLARSLTGTYAQQALCEPHQVHPLPDRVSFEQGAGVWIAYGTAYRALITRAAARAHDWVLVHGASGGVGTASVQLARSLGMRVIGTAGTREGREHVLAQGALHALDHTSPAYLDEIRRITSYPSGGVDVVLEMLANLNLDNDLGVLAMGGRVVVIGNRGSIEINPRQTMARDSSILGMSLLHAREAEILRLAAAIGAGLENGSLTPVVGAVLPLAGAREAHAKVLAPGSRGKIVLKV